MGLLLSRQKCHRAGAAQHTWRAARGIIHRKGLINIMHAAKHLGPVGIAHILALFGSICGPVANLTVVGDLSNCLVTQSRLSNSLAGRLEIGLLVLMARLEMSREAAAGEALSNSSACNVLVIAMR